MNDDTAPRRGRGRLPVAPQDKLHRTVTYLTESEQAAIAKAAKAQGVAPSVWIRTAVCNALAASDHSKKPGA